MTDMSRRKFAESVMASALVPLLGPAMPPPSAGWWERLSPGVTALPSGAGDLDTLAGALADVIRVQYGDRLGESDFAAVTRHIRNALERAEQMRRVELANGDEPDFVFSSPADAPG